MNRRRLSLFIVIGVIGGRAFLGAVTPAEPVTPAVPANPAPAGDAAVDRELDELLKSIQPAWTTSASLRTAFGYKHNLLLSPTNGADSAFARAGVETLLWHVPTGRVDYFGFVNGEYTRYAKKDTDTYGQSVDHEAQAFAGLEWRFRQGDVFSFALDPQGYFLDQIFDVSDTVGRTSIEELKVTGGKIGPTVRWSPLSWVWVEANATVERQKFRDGLNDDRIRDASLRLGWKPLDRVELSVAGVERRRGFDRRTQITADGPQDGLLVIHEREARARAIIEWGHGRGWKTITRAGVLHYTDNAAGYLNFMQRRVGQEIEWSAGKWLVNLEGTARRKDYEGQTVGAGISPPALIKDEYTATLRIERKLSERWTVYGEYEWERSRSNDRDPLSGISLSSYRMNEGLLGLRWSWEK